MAENNIVITYNGWIEINQKIYYSILYTTTNNNASFTILKQYACILSDDKYYYQLCNIELHKFGHALRTGGK